MLRLRVRRREEERRMLKPGEGINKTVFISPFKGECSLSFVFVLIRFFNVYTVHRFKFAYFCMERKGFNGFGFNVVWDEESREVSRTRTPATSKFNPGFCRGRKASLVHIDHASAVPALRIPPPNVLLGC
jgi:hypothetical protein